MQEFIHWLYATPLSQTLKATSWIIPTVQTIHILCIALLFTSMIMLGARLLGVAGTRHSIDSFASRFLPWLWWPLPVMLLTGVILVIAEPDRDLQNTAFYLKLSLLITVCAITLYFQRVSMRSPDAWESSPGRRTLARLIGLTSILLWTSIVVCGRMIAYV